MVGLVTIKPICPLLRWQEHDVCLQREASTVKPPRVDAALTLLGLAAGFGLAFLVLSGRKAALVERLRATEADNTRLDTELATEKAGTV